MTKKKTINRNYWKKEEEIIIKKWADKAQCYQWMHGKCRNIYKKKNSWYSIPVIIISTVTGTANFAQDRFSDDIKQYMVMLIGTLSIIAGIITTIYQFLKISELHEGHRVAEISWGKFHNNLQTLILRHPLDRDPPSISIKVNKDEYDRLIEISPIILNKIVVLFNTKFKKNDDLFVPEICNKLDSTRVYDISNEERQNMIINLNGGKTNKKLITQFFNLNGRVPTDLEINNIENNIDMLNDNVENDEDDEDLDNNISMNIIDSFNNIEESDSNSDDGNEENNEENNEDNLMDNEFINTSHV